jgi:hypothetical protein
MIAGTVVAPGTVRATGPINAPTQQNCPPLSDRICMRNLLSKISALLLTAALWSACSAIDRIENIGEAPRARGSGKSAGQQIVAAIPRPAPITHVNNSLWQPGAMSFFHDPRAMHVGDVDHRERLGD